jgi:acetyltransferase-like isoleucine patch superfamily enzyme
MSLSGFASVGQDVTIWPLAKIIAPEVISIGNSVIIDDFVLIMGGKKTSIGSFVHISAFSSLVGGGDLVLEDFATISGGVRVYTGTDDFLGGSLTNSAVPSRYRKPIRSFVHVGKHAAIGAGTIILPGVTIGEGAAVGASSLVRSDCKPWTIYVGSPARELKPRPSETILSLERDLRRELYDSDGRYIPSSAR